MKPIRPKMKKVLLTGFVACMSLFNASSAAPVPHRSSRPTESPSSASTTPATADIIETAAVGPPSPPSPATTPSSARQAPPSSGNRSRRARGSGGDTSPSSNAHPSVARPSSFSLASLGLGPIDYAAASIARRVSRIFVKRMSAQSGARIPTTTTTMTTQTETAGGEDNNEDVNDGEREVLQENKDVIDTEEAEINPSGPVIEFVDLSHPGTGTKPGDDDDMGTMHSNNSPGSRSDHDETEIAGKVESQAGGMSSVEARACRWGCI